jgi:hypothetical protein
LYARNFALGKTLAEHVGMAVRSHHFLTIAALAAAGIICTTSPSEGGQFSPGVEASLSEVSISDTVVSDELCMSTEELSTEDLFCVERDQGAMEFMVDDFGIMSLGTGDMASCMAACEAGTKAIEAFCQAIRDPRIRFACMGVRFARPLCHAFCAKYY